jgi:hypothetical protein
MDVPMTAPGTDWVPDSCTLPTVEQPLRMAEFDTLFASSHRSVERSSERRARLVLTGDETLAARAQQLADAEASCCSFFSFTLTPLTPDRANTTSVALDIEVPPARSEVLAALVGRAEQARRAGS